MTDVVIEGIEDVIARDLAKHKALLERLTIEVQAFRQGRAHEIKKQKHYAGLVGNGQFSDVALRTAMDDIAINIRHMSDKVQTGEEQIVFNKRIVETLTLQLAVQQQALDALARHRRDNASGD